MKAIFSLDEVRAIVRKEACRLLSIEPKEQPVRFMHRYLDGSGEGEADLITPVDRVEIEL